VSLEAIADTRAGITEAAVGALGVLLVRVTSSEGNFKDVAIDHLRRTADGVDLGGACRCGLCVGRYRHRLHLRLGAVAASSRVKHALEQILLARRGRVGEGNVEGIAPNHIATINEVRHIDSRDHEIREVLEGVANAVRRVPLESRRFHAILGDRGVCGCRSTAEMETRCRGRPDGACISAVALGEERVHAASSMRVQFSITRSAGACLVHLTLGVSPLLRRPHVKVGLPGRVRGVDKDRTREVFSAEHVGVLERDVAVQVEHGVCGIIIDRIGSVASGNEDVRVACVTDPDTTVTSRAGGFRQVPGDALVAVVVVTRSGAGPGGQIVLAPAVGLIRAVHSSHETNLCVGLGRATTGGGMGLDPETLDHVVRCTIAIVGASGPAVCDGVIALRADARGAVVTLPPAVTSTHAGPARVPELRAEFSRGLGDVGRVGSRIVDAAAVTGAVVRALLATAAAPLVSREAFAFTRRAVAHALGGAFSVRVEATEAISCRYDAVAFRGPGEAEGALAQRAVLARPARLACALIGGRARTVATALVRASSHGGTCRHCDHKSEELHGYGKGVEEAG